MYMFYAGFNLHALLSSALQWYVKEALKFFFPQSFTLEYIFKELKVLKWLKMMCTHMKWTLIILVA